MFPSIDKIYFGAQDKCIEFSIRSNEQKVIFKAEEKINSILIGHNLRQLPDWKSLYRLTSLIPIAFPYS